MSILRRFKAIMSSNVNALLDKAEDPEKMIDQYLRDLNKDLGNVKSETATVMANEQRALRELQECEKEVENMETYAMKALEANDEADARKFLQRKAVLAEQAVELQKAHELAVTNSEQMREMHDKLVGDINELESRRSILKGKAAVAKTQKKMNEMGSSLKGAASTKSAFDQMEDKINQSLDEAKAMALLNKTDDDDIENLMDKYTDKTETEIDDELEALKRKMEESK
ncbi:MAG TPA: PspA/IM30 family protein [Pseudogracilibacillus sp.]|nr:PspA/IM30 family protein [Pseudogracilibacillus sp.]